METILNRSEMGLSLDTKSAEQRAKELGAKLPDVKLEAMCIFLK